MESNKILKGLSRVNLNLNADVIKNLNADVINNLNADVINNLNADVINSLPVLSNPYTVLLNDIQSKNRNYQQSTYGKIETYSEEINICGSAMCIAGHFVNMCKKEGYEAKDKFGRATSAGLIHLKAHPTAPVFDYTIQNQEFGMAYIEMMADYEQSGFKTFNDYLNENLK